MNTTIFANSTFHYQVIEKVTDDFTNKDRYLSTIWSRRPDGCEKKKRTIGVA